MKCVIFSIPVRLVRHANIEVLLGKGIPDVGKTITPIAEEPEPENNLYRALASRGNIWPKVFISVEVRYSYD